MQQYKVPRLNSSKISSFSSQKSYCFNPSGWLFISPSFKSCFNSSSFNLFILFNESSDSYSYYLLSMTFSSNPLLEYIGRLPKKSWCEFPISLTLIWLKYPQWEGKAMKLGFECIPLQSNTIYPNEYVSLLMTEW